MNKMRNVRTCQAQGLQEAISGILFRFTHLQHTPRNLSPINIHVPKALWSTAIITCMENVRNTRERLISELSFCLVKNVRDHGIKIYVEFSVKSCTLFSS